MTMSNSPNILVIGGGVIGCSVAYELARRGNAVTVVDKGRIGHGCSYGNAGWLVPAHAMPLPMPGAVGQALQWMTKKDSPLYLKPRFSPSMALWLIRFMRCANERHLTYAAPALVKLALRTLVLMESFIEEHGGDDLDFRKRDLLYVCRSKQGLQHALRELEIVRDLGLQGVQLSSRQLKEREPLIAGETAGGLLLEDQAQIEPLRFVEALAGEARQLAATFLPNTEVHAIEAGGNRVTRVITSGGDFTPDEVVLAAGSWTAPLARLLNLRVPIQAGKGYALIVTGVEQQPSRCLFLVESKVAVTPRIGSLRIAGTMELAGLDESMNQVRVEAIRRAAHTYLDLPTSVETVETWCGLRPCTPDGVPMIGRNDHWKNVTLAAGHAMLGLTLSMGTGELVAQLLNGEDTITNPTPFKTSRF